MLFWKGLASPYIIPVRMRDRETQRHREIKTWKEPERVIEYTHTPYSLHMPDSNTHILREREERHIRTVTQQGRGRNRAHHTDNKSNLLLITDTEFIFTGVERA